MPWLAADPMQPVKVSTLEHKSTTNAIVEAKDRKSAKGTTVAKAGKVIAAAKWAKGRSIANSTMRATAKEVIPAKEVANQPKEVARTKQPKGPVEVTKGPSAASQTKTRGSGKGSKGTEEAPASNKPAAKGIPAPAHVQITQIAQTSAAGSGTETRTSHAHNQDRSHAESMEDPSRVQPLYPESWRTGGSGVPRSACEALARNRGRRGGTGE